MDTSLIREHMEVVGSDGKHVGTVDGLEGHNIILTKNDEAAGGEHHSIPIEWVRSVDRQAVRLNKSAEDAMSEWEETHSLM